MDVYVEGRLIATCPVAAPSFDTGRIERELLIGSARQMLKADDIMTDAELSRALFNVRRVND